MHLIVVIILVFSSHAGDTCSTKEGNEGICKLIRECPHLQEKFLVTSPLIFIHQYGGCGFVNENLYLCCPTTASLEASSVTSALPESTVATALPESTVAKALPESTVATAWPEAIDKRTSKTPKCMNGWFLFENSCYFFSSTAATWRDGRQQCLEMGADYVKISSDAEFTFILSLVVDDTWIGLNDIEREGIYKWVSDGTVSEINRAWWHNNQPDDAGGIEDCVHVWFREGRKLLNDLSGTRNQLFYICEMMPETTSV